MLQPADYDRCYRLLGLIPGASLQQIEDSWKARFAALHPDKFPAGAKERATRRAQEINNARDELRHYWRRHGKAPPSGTEHQLSVRPYRPDPAGRPAGPGTAPEQAAAPEAAGGSAAGPDRRPEPARRGGRKYAAVAGLSLLAVAGFSFAMLSDRQDRDAPPAVAPPSASADATATARADRSDGASASAATSAAYPRSAVTASAEAVLPQTNYEMSATIAPPPGGPVAGPYRVPAARPSPRTAAPASVPSGHGVQRGGWSGMATAALQACRADLQTYCAGVEFGAGRMAQCARQHFRQLSAGCSNALLALRAARQQPAAAPARR